MADKGRIQVFANSIAELCCKKYAELPKKGKPGSKEWTLLSGIVKVDTSDEPFYQRMEVISVGTGSKCLGEKNMSKFGDIVNDSHAEVLARRGLLRYLYRQLYLQYSTNCSDIFIGVEDGKCILKDTISFHMFSSHPPCGDASIFPKEFVFQEDYGTSLSPEPFNSTHSTDVAEKRKVVDSVSQDFESKTKKLRGTVFSCDTDDFNVVKMSKGDHYASVELPDKGMVNDTVNALVKDIYRTGAKCLDSEIYQDPHLPGRGYHVVGVLRTKPGRGPRTLSLSCSDKLSRWSIVGIQGALLSLFLSKPIYLQSVIIGGGCPYSEHALDRAITGRLTNTVREQLQPPYSVCSPSIVQATVLFKDARSSDGKQSVCPSSLIWCSVPDRPLEVAVCGRKQGVTKKVLGTPSGRLLICKKELLKQFVNVLCAIEKSEYSLPFPLPSDYLNCSYLQWKILAKEYKCAWRTAKLLAYPAWRSKPDCLLSFTANEDA